MLLLGWLLHGCAITRSQGLALGLSYAGVLLVLGRELHLDGADTAKGALLVLGSAISYAVYLSRSGEVVHEIGTLRTTGWATRIACGLCIAQFLLLRPVEAALLPAPVLWLSLLNATACTFVPVLCVMAAIQRVGAPLAAQAGMVGPMSTLLLGAWLLGEPLGGTVLAGTALVLAGVALLARATTPAGIRS